MPSGSSEGISEANHWMLANTALSCIAVSCILLQPADDAGLVAGRQSQCNGTLTRNGPTCQALCDEQPQGHAPVSLCVCVRACACALRWQQKHYRTVRIQCPNRIQELSRSKLKTIIKAGVCALPPSEVATNQHVFVFFACFGKLLQKGMPSQEEFELKPAT